MSALLKLTIAEPLSTVLLSFIYNTGKGKTMDDQKRLMALNFVSITELLTKLSKVTQYMFALARLFIILPKVKGKGRNKVKEEEKNNKTIKVISQRKSKREERRKYKRKQE